MQNPNLPRQIRSVLEGSSDAVSLHELLVLIDDFVLECTSSSEPELLLVQLEEDLHKIHHETVDHSSLNQTEVFLAVLFHLSPILPPTTIISWFDIVLRPALREPKLPTSSVKCAKELIIQALQKKEDVYVERLKEFLCRLLDLYLLDAFNEGSGDDILEWAELDEEQRNKRSHWKWNLEDILLKFGAKSPEDLMTEIYNHFENPTLRLQLFMLLDHYITQSSSLDLFGILANHPLMTSIIHSLLLDTSSTACTAGLTLMVKLLPGLAVNTRLTLRSLLPKLLAILARIMSWKERPPPSGPEEPSDPVFERELDNEANRQIPIHPDLKWERLQQTFQATTSHPPSPRLYFTILYYLYPSNVLQFLSAPALYLMNTSTSSPYALQWDNVLAKDEIRRRSERILREHVCHPLLIWRDAAAELSEHEFWIRYNIPRITSEAGMLDVRNSALGIRSHEQALQDESDNESTLGGEDNVPARLIHPIDISTEKVVISLQDMINVTLALNSHLEVEIVQPEAQWPSTLFGTPFPRSSELTPSPSGAEETPSEFVTVISGLQQELLLLRNELNFERYLSRENIKHIGRLYQDRILAKSAEVERQGLYNKLRNYRAQVVALEAELQEHKQQASSAKNKYADWNSELQKKLKEFREEKKAWLSEAAYLRTAEKEAQSLFEAQKGLLAEANREVFELRTQKKETQHKIDRLRDYERQIEQFIKLQGLWDDDFAKFNQRGEEIELMRNQYHQMKIRLKSYEEIQAEMEETARAQLRRIRTLEAQLAQANQSVQQTHRKGHPLEYELSILVAEKVSLQNSNKRLKEENNELKDELEGMGAMIEVLKSQHSGKRGLISEPRASPVQFT